MDSNNSDLQTSSNSKSIAKGNLKLVSASQSERSGIKKGAEDQRHWTALTAGAGKGMSLPQYFIHEPKKFLNEFYPLYRDLAECDDDDLTDIDLEAFEIIENLAHIKLPLRYRGSATVVQTYGQLQPYVIEVVEDVNKGRLNKLLDTPSDIMSCTCFDLLWPYRNRISGKDFKRVVGYVLDQIDGDHIQVWDRKRCELFFSNASNFVPMRNRKHFW